MEEQETQPEIYVGKKPVHKYVKAVRYRVEELGEAKIVARGSNIRKAVLTAEIVKRETEEDHSNYEDLNISVNDITTLTEHGENDDGSTFTVSKIIFDVTGTVNSKE